MNYNIQNKVYSLLRDRILNLDILPGTSLSEVEMAKELQISRTPVREAFIHLSREGLVEIIPQKGTLVSLIDLERIEEEFFLRKNLELAVFELLIAQNSSTLFIELELLLKKQEETLNDSSPINFFKYDNQFHELFFKATHQTMSWQIITTMSGHYYRLRMLTTFVKQISRDRMAEHQEIVKALKSKNLKEAKTLLYNHLHHIKEDEKLLMQQYPCYFCAKNRELAQTSA